jgi:hypothetical protein
MIDPLLEKIVTQCFGQNYRIWNKICVLVMNVSLTKALMRHPLKYTVPDVYNILRNMSPVFSKIKQI